VEVWLLFQFELTRLAALTPLLNSMALLIAFGGAWLLLATRWRRQLARQSVGLARGAHAALGEHAGAAATQRIDRFFYGFGFSSLGLAWLLSSLTRLV